MKTINYLFKVFVLLTLFIPVTTLAQDGHYYTVTTWKLEIPENGSSTELNELFKEFSEKVSFKNDKVLSEKILRHVYGSDLRDWIIISEYANWNDIEAANEAQNKLTEEAWPNEEERKKFYQSWAKYVVTHSDEIYQELPALTKK